MAQPEYTEHRMTPPLPPTVELCPRCRRGILVFLGTGDSHPFVWSEERPNGWCYVCGGAGRGTRYHMEPTR